MPCLIPSPATTDAIPLQSHKRSRARITCHCRVRTFSILGDSVSSAICIRHPDLRFYLQAPWKWNHCNDTPKANFTLVWHKVQGNSAAGSLWKFSFPCYFLPRIFFKKRKKRTFSTFKLLFTPQSEQSLQQIYVQWTQFTKHQKIKHDQDGSISLEGLYHDIVSNIPKHKLFPVTISISNPSERYMRNFRFNCCPLRWTLKQS